MSASPEQRIANRIDVEKVSFDPISILTIITTVLPLLSRCFNRNDDVTPEQTRARVAKLNQRDPERLLKRTAKNVLQKARRDHKKMTAAESREFARAIIDETLATPESEVAALCRDFNSEEDEG